MKRVAPAALLLVAVAAAALLLRREGYSADDHERFQTALWRLKSLDAAFNEDLLRARFSLLENYDRFQTYQREMTGLVEHDLVPPRFVGPEVRALIGRGAAARDARRQTRRQTVERFKSLN